MNPIPWWEGLGGLSHGSFFRAIELPKKSSSQSETTCQTEDGNAPENLSEMTVKILTGEAFCYSPNLSWLLMAVAAWWVFPYNLDTTEGGNTTVYDALIDRLAINLFLALGYIGFWHCALYVREYCQDPFVPSRVYEFRKVLHNLFYTVLGILEWTAVEGAFVYLYKSGKLPYKNAATDPVTLLQTMVLSVALVSYRDVHFYFAHWLIHLRTLFRYVHSLHHRNTDTEPFSGLAMHPVEHTYYYTSYGPLLVIPSLSPFLVFWMGVHLVLSPAASHSGYGDHFSVDLYHYLHHRYCECNYSAGINFDVPFGTYGGHCHRYQQRRKQERRCLLPPPTPSRPCREFQNTAPMGRV